MHKEARERIEGKLKLVVLEHASHFGVTKACREFNVHRSTFYRWKQKYDKEGRSGLYRKKSVAHNYPRKTSPEVIENILETRTDHQIGVLRITYYLDRYHGIKISESTVTRVLRAHGIRQLPKTAPRHALHTKQYAKEVPGHHVQVGVKFLRLKDREGKIVKPYQYTAINDATRIRALQIFAEHKQDCAIKFMDFVIEKFPFRISMVRTDRGHEFQTHFHWHAEDQGIQHLYIKPRTPH